MPIRIPTRLISGDSRATILLRAQKTQRPGALEMPSQAKAITTQLVPQGDDGVEGACFVSDETSDYAAEDGACV